MELFSRFKKFMGFGKVEPQSTGDKKRDSESDAPVNHDLVESVSRVVALDNQTNRDRLYASIRNSSPLIACDEATVRAAAQAGKIDEGAQLNFTTIAGISGQVVLPIFTDEQALLAWSPNGAAYLWLAGTDLLTLAAQNKVDALAINPAGPIGGVVDGDEFSKLLGDQATA